ncbi:MAG: hypothetical protein IJT58_07030 [Synergistaceae bacterium]|nr:hypothetical protein [Synergistaceae bacterium]
MAEQLSREEFLAKMHEYEEFYREHHAAIREYLFNKRFEQDMARTRQLEREEAYARGFKKGLLETLDKDIVKAVRALRKQGNLSVEQIAETLHLSVEVVEAL